MTYREEDADSVKNRFLEDARMNFNDATDVHDWELAQIIVEDIKDQDPEEGKALDELLADMKANYISENDNGLVDDMREREAE